MLGREKKQRETIGLKVSRLLFKGKQEGSKKMP